MADKAAQKVVSIAIKRERPFPLKVIIATGFKLRSDKSSGLIDILLEVGGQKGERIIFDPIILRSNLNTLKQFAAASAIDPDDTAQKEDLLVGEQPSFSNIVHLSRMENRGETTFSTFSLHDWVEATRQTSGAAEIKCIENTVVVSSAGFQKKFVLELIILISQLVRQ